MTNLHGFNATFEGDLKQSSKYPVREGVRTLLLLVLFLLGTLQLEAQASARVGLRIGVGTSDVTTDEVRFGAGGRDFGIALANAKQSLHGGLFLQVKLAKLVIQPEVLFVSTRNDYVLRELTSTSILESIRSENYQSLDIPLMIAYKWGPLRLQAGPVGHIYIADQSDLIGTAEYASDFEKYQLGYQAGVGLDLWNVLLDFKYQSGFSDFGSHLTFAGQRIAFDRSPSQLVIGIGLSFN